MASTMNSTGWTTVAPKMYNKYVPPSQRAAAPKTFNQEFPSLVKGNHVKRSTAPAFAAVLKKVVAEEEAAAADATAARLHAEAKLSKQQRETAEITAHFAKLPSLSNYVRRAQLRQLEDSRRRRRARLFPSGRLFDSAEEEAEWKAGVEKQYAEDEIDDNQSVDDSYDHGDEREDVADEQDHDIGNRRNHDDWMV